MTIYETRLSHWQRIKVRPFEHAVAALLLYSGIVRLVTGRLMMDAALIPALAYSWAIVGILAGILILAGIHASSGIVGRATERVGWIFSLLALLATPAIILYLLPFSVIGDLVGTIMPGIAAIFRIWHLRDEQVAERKMAKTLSDVAKRVRRAK